MPFLNVELSSYDEVQLYVGYQKEYACLTGIAGKEDIHLKKLTTYYFFSSYTFNKTC